MTFKRKFLSLLIVLLITTVYSQEEVKTEQSPAHQRHLLLAYGQVYHLKLDQTYSRLAKRGFNHSFALGYHNLNQRHFFGGQLNFMTGKLGTKGNQINFLTNYAGGLQLWYLKKLTSWNALDLYLGLNLGLRGEIWFPPPDLLRYGWDINSGLGASSIVNYKIKPTLEVRYRLDLQLFGVLWRSHNNGQQLTTETIQLERGLVATAFENSYFSQPFNSFYFDQSFLLSYTIAEKWKLWYRLTIAYKQIKLPVLKKGYQFDNLIGVAYQF